jgi:protein ImuB
MPLALARALCPKAQYHLWDPSGDLRALEKTAVRALNITPLCALEPEVLEAQRADKLQMLSPLHMGLILDLTGTSRLHKSEELLCSSIQQRFARVGIEARLATGPSIGAAWAITRFGGDLGIIPSSANLKEMFAAYPLQALRIAQPTQAALSSIGLHYLGDLLILNRKKIALRYGVEIIKRIDQLLGVVNEPILCIQETKPLCVKKHYDIPLHSRALICTCLLELLVLLFNKLISLKRKAALFCIEVRGKSLQGQIFIQKKEITLNSATRSLLHIQSVLTPLIERMSFSGFVDTLIIEAKYLEFSQAEQGSYLDVANLAQLVTNSKEFINSLVTQLGNKHVCLLQLQKSHIPEKSFSYCPIPAQHAPQIISRDRLSLFTAERPSHLLKQPEPIIALAMLPDRAPVRIVWREEELKVVQALGPEKIAAEWWNTNALQMGEREYFRLLDMKGRWLWVFRDNASQQWFMHGMWQ